MDQKINSHGANHKKKSFDEDDFEQSYAMVLRTMEEHEYPLTAGIDLEMSALPTVPRKARYESPHAVIQHDVSYDAPLIHVQKRKVLGIACSGGNGHKEAMKALLNMPCFTAENLPEHTPTPYANKPPSITGLAITAGSRLIDLPYLKGIVDRLNLVVLPSRKKMLEAIHQLDNPEPRLYIDVLLDIYEAGYESGALWNINQREDNTHQLSLLVALQSENDAYNYPTTYQYYIDLFEHAYQEEASYTEIISTQAIGLPALCDAVQSYNERGLYREKLVIHQYMTDLPTPGAVHFFKVFSQLTPLQQQQMKIYAVDMNQAVLDLFFKHGHHFLGLYRMHSAENPMIRHGFKDPKNDHSADFKGRVVLAQCLRQAPVMTKAELIVLENERIAAIMLGSQASTDTVRYIENLLLNGMDKVFIFGGSNAAIETKVTQFMGAYPHWANQIILLDNQDDVFIASLMTRSQVLIIRAGGLSVMEQMAMNHHAEQIIMIHHADSGATEMTSGISWEDANADVLIQTLRKKNITIVKTCPSESNDQLIALLHNEKAIEMGGWTRL